jgi:mRNA interferase HigB
VQVLGKDRIEDAKKSHSTWKASLDSWVRIVEGVTPSWDNFPAVRQTRRDADPVGDCVVFNIAHNEARLVSSISYQMETVTVLFVLTHKDYDKGGWKSACNC